MVGTAQERLCPPYKPAALRQKSRTAVSPFSGRSMAQPVLQCARQTRPRQAKTDAPYTFLVRSDSTNTSATEKRAFTESKRGCFICILVRETQSATGSDCLSCASCSIGAPVKGSDDRRLLLDPVMQLPEAHGALGRLHRQPAEIAFRDLHGLLVDRRHDRAVAQDDFTVGQFRRADRQGMSRRSARGPSISRATISIGISLRSAIETVTSSNFFEFGEIIDRRIVQLVQPLHQFHDLLGEAEVSPRGGVSRAISFRTRLISSWTAAARSPKAGREPLPWLGATGQP